MSEPASSTRTDDLSVSRGATPVQATPSAPTSSASDAPVGQLLGDLTQEVSRLVRSEVQLAKIDLAAKGKKAGLGLGMFTGAGLLAFFAVGTLVATAVLALALALPAWLAALIVAVVLLAVAGVLALVGKKEVQQAVPPVPQDAVDGLKKDAATVKENLHP